MKAWYESKILWAGVLGFLVSALEIFAAWYDRGDFSVTGCTTLAISLLVVVLRVWFTNTPIDTPKAQEQLRRDVSDGLR